MYNVTFKGEKVKIKGPLPNLKEQAPPFTLTNQDLQDLQLEDLGSKIKVLNIFPSLDTSVCAHSIRAFYKSLQGRDDLVLLNISMDLPFAAKRFCDEHTLSGAITLSAFRSSFADDYGVKILEGPLKGLCCRVVLILDASNTVLYREIVNEITNEPDYDRAISMILPKK